MVVGEYAAISKNQDILDKIPPIPNTEDRGLYDSIEELLTDTYLWYALGFRMLEEDRDQANDDGGLKHRDYTFLYSGQTSMQIDAKRRVMAVFTTSDTPLEYAEILRYGIRAGYTVLEISGTRMYQLTEPHKDWPIPHKYTEPALGVE